MGAEALIQYFMSVLSQCIGVGIFDHDLVFLQYSDADTTALRRLQCIPSTNPQLLRPVAAAHEALNSCSTTRMAVAESSKQYGTVNKQHHQQQQQLRHPEVMVVWHPAVAGVTSVQHGTCTGNTWAQPAVPPYLRGKL
jgi:hypothetical protein